MEITVPRYEKKTLFMSVACFSEVGECMFLFQAMGQSLKLVDKRGACLCCMLNQNRKNWHEVHLDLRLSEQSIRTSSLQMSGNAGDRPRRNQASK